MELITSDLRKKSIHIYITKLSKDLLKESIKTLEFISQNDSLKIITLNLCKYKCTDLSIDTLKLINMFFNILVINPLLLNNYNNLILRFIHDLVKYNVIDHIAKILINSGKGFKEIRYMMYSIYNFLIIIKTSGNFDKRNNVVEKLYISCLNKLIFESMFTRHMIFCVICYDVKNILTLKEFKIENNNLILPTLKINDSTPEYIKAYEPNKKQYNIMICDLGMLAYLTSEILKTGISIAFDNKTILLKMINNIESALLHIKLNNIQFINIINIIDACNYVKNNIK